MITELYSKIIHQIVPVQSIRVAEAVKMLENAFRNVNISLIYEVAMLFEKIGINTWDVIGAASTKPYAFMPHYPGPGIGGHCIPKDPYYFLSGDGVEANDLKILRTSLEVSESMPSHVVELVRQNVRNNARVGVLGVAYKRNVPDTRGAPAEEIIKGLEASGFRVKVFDPMVKEGFGASSVGYEETVSGKDCILMLTDHDYFAGVEEKIGKYSPDAVVVDTRNFIDPKRLPHTVRYIGLGNGGVLDAMGGILRKRSRH
jgi:UDP-N-acetyl-D-glucosamine dehydrogenase